MMMLLEEIVKGRDDVYVLVLNNHEVTISVGMVEEVRN